MLDSNPAAMPIDLNQKISAKMSPASEVDKQEMAKVPYMQAIGCLLFAAQTTRPDISFAVNLLSRFSTNPGKAHWAAVKRVMRYLKGTIKYGISYNKEACNLTGFCDSDWASDLDERRSTTGYLFKLQDGPISWCTRRQRTIALSSTEAEFMAMTSAIQEATWLMRLQKELTPDTAETLVLHCDNKSAIQVALNNSYSPRTKHVDIKDKFIRQHLESGKIKLVYIPTKEMLADILTKGVSKVIHINLSSFANTVFK
ncbi:secreted RxLR effector protein 161-like [Rhagoletis pomonella]|uniref:secreted RxLR effector protein 161-like n=1 Tax=Rhagoletis pomonella TaxID=28610 RepID=UPI001781516D|nr:secreted RxLR effector protein 161-like [Rhagoletis pomonella]